MGNVAQTVAVDLGERSYNILIGADLLDDLGEHVRTIRKGASCAIITDTNVAALHLARVEDALARFDIGYHVICVQPGEGSKSFETLQTVVDQLLDTKLGRGDFVVAFGGGVVGDLAGFAAAIARRGMGLVQVPTSLLAQVDSAVGGKTGINAPQGKNLIGAFHQPRLVLADTQSLTTLDRREFAAGYAEIVKYGLIDDADFFSELEAEWRDVFGFGDKLVDAIATSCRAKAAIVAADERESGQRALLNLGHTFGHALEAACAYDPGRLIHGEGVAIGLVLAHEFSNRLNLCDADAARRIKRHLDEVGLPTSPAQIPGELPLAEKLMDFIYQDKKVLGGRLTFILSKGLGKAYIADDVPPSEVLAFLEGALG